MCYTHSDAENENAYLDRLFVGMSLHKHRKHTVSLRYEYVHDFLKHQIDENAFHMCDNHNVVHCDESNDVDNILNQSKMFCDNQNICMVARLYDTYEYDHLNRDEW